ncbi:hypothetical protein GCM10022198_09610 [Klugiella xanthotipulae]|uniref:Uncharacterized protein n=1 Tax=Klugiella xanthotipulae TaxID=244735 RepID=A0A543I6T3_9MICO|nr:hypothetical protein [Klugiella xanthotipulae]TQM66261.1 hypothetical protein FB466_1098 [Klugiella xanthotipulae]
MSAVLHESATAATGEASAFRLVSSIRAAVYVPGAIVLAFTAHLHRTIMFDLIFVGIFGIVSALALGATVFRVGVRSLGRAVVAHAALNAAVGILALTLVASALEAQSLVSGDAAAVAQALTLREGVIDMLAILVIAWAAGTAVIDVLLGWFSRGRSYARDYFVLAACAAILAIVCLFVGEDIVALMGFCGGYLAIAGVYLGIAAASVGVTPHPRGSVQAEIQS